MNLVIDAVLLYIAVLWKASLMLFGIKVLGHTCRHQSQVSLQWVSLVGLYYDMVAQVRPEIKLDLKDRVRAVLQHNILCN